MTTPILETERLILRPMTVQDAEQIFENWASDPEVARYMRWDLHKSVQTTKEWMQRMEADIANDKTYDWGFELKETGKLIGSGGIYYKEEKGMFELGYNLMRKYWRQGYTTEASRAILDFGIKTLGQNQFFCGHAVDNIGSMKVMTGLGFVYDCDYKYSKFSGNETFPAKGYILTVK